MNDHAIFPVIRDVPPLPRTRRSKYGFERLEVGDAIDAPRDMSKGKNGDDLRSRSMANAARFWMTRPENAGKVITVRILDAATVRARRDR